MLPRELNPDPRNQGSERASLTGAPATADCHTLSDINHDVAQVYPIAALLIELCVELRKKNPDTTRSFEKDGVSMTWTTAATFCHPLHRKRAYIVQSSIQPYDNAVTRRSYNARSTLCFSDPTVLPVDLFFLLLLPPLPAGDPPSIHGT